MENCGEEQGEATKQDSGGGGGGGGGTTAAAPAAVRRPMNAFLIFCKRHRSLVREKNQHLDNRSVTRILGELWASLPAEEKLTYTDLAKQYKDAFMKANPDYKWYNPEKSTAGTGTVGTAPSKSPPQPLSRHIVLSQGRKGTGDAVTPGKLADPSNMGGLSLLLMAGNSLDNNEKSPPQPAKAKATSLLQLAEMCTTALEDPEAQPESTERPRAVTMVTNNWSAMTPPYTPKHETSPKQDNTFESWTSVKVDQKPNEPPQETKFKANQPSNQIQTSKSSAPMFRTKAALKSPPQFVGSQYSSEGFTEIKAPVVNKKLYSIVPVPSTQDSKPETKSLPPPPPKSGITMDNFIESMFCHEGKFEATMQQQKQIADLSTAVQPSMTFGQIQEQLIRKAMESSYTDPVKNEKSEAIPKVELVCMHPKTEASILPQLIPSSLSAQISVGLNGSLTVSAPPTSQPVPVSIPIASQVNPAEDKKEVSLAPFIVPFLPTLSKADTERMECKEEVKEEEEDLTCHEKMDESSPVTREEMEKKLLSSAEKIQAALNSDLPVATPKIPSDERSASVVRKLEPTATEQPVKKKRKTTKAASTKPTPPVIKEDNERKTKTPSPTYSEPKSGSWKRHDSARTEDNSDSDTERHLHISQDSEVGEGEDSGGGLRKSHRRNRGKRYQQLVSQGLIHSSRHKQRTESQSEEACEKGDKDFTPSPGTLPSLGITRKRKRTVSESSATEESIKYKTGDFDLEEKIARLRPCLIDCPPAQASGAPGGSSVGGGVSKKHKRHHHHHHRPRHVSTSALSASSTAAHPHLSQHRRFSHDTRPQHPPTKSDVVNIAELRLLPGPDGAGSGDATLVTGSARRKVRKHAIRRLVPMPGTNTADAVNNNSVHPSKPDNSTSTNGHKDSDPSKSPTAHKETAADTSNETVGSNTSDTPSHHKPSDTTASGKPPPPTTTTTNTTKTPFTNSSSSSSSLSSSSPSHEKENAVTSVLDVNSNSSQHTSLAAPPSTGPADHSNLATFAHLATTAAADSRDKTMRELGQSDAIRVSS